MGPGAESEAREAKFQRPVFMQGPYKLSNRRLFKEQTPRVGALECKNLTNKMKKHMDYHKGQHKA